MEVNLDYQVPYQSAMPAYYAFILGPGQSATCDFELQRYELTNALAVVTPGEGATVGNEIEVKVRLTWRLGVTGPPLASPPTVDLALLQDAPQEQEPPTHALGLSRLRWENAQNHGDDPRHPTVSVDWVFPWYTTHCFNDWYDLSADCELSNIYTGLPLTVMNGSWNLVANLYLDHVARSARPAP